MAKLQEAAGTGAHVVALTPATLKPVLPEEGNEEDNAQLAACDSRRKNLTEFGIRLQK
jgi:hypothetical protein